MQQARAEVRAESAMAFNPACETGAPKPPCPGVDLGYCKHWLLPSRISSAILLTVLYTELTPTCHTFFLCMHNGQGKLQSAWIAIVYAVKNMTFTHQSNHDCTLVRNNHTGELFQAASPYGLIQDSLLPRSKQLLSGTSGLFCRSLVQTSQGRSRWVVQWSSKAKWLEVCVSSDLTW